MDIETATELIFNQGYYYPAVPNYYGYYCTGFESPVEWDDHHKFFSSDGSDLLFSGFQTENMPYVYYYTPNYEYAQSPYNPHNPYVSGAIPGVDSPFVGIQQYYSYPNQYPISSSVFVPVNVQPGSEFFPNTSLDPILLHAGVPSSVMPDIVPKHTPTAASAVVVGPTKKSASGNARKDSALAASHQHHAANFSKGSKVDSALVASHQPVLLGTTSKTASHPIPSQVTQNRSASGSTHVANHFSQGNLSSLQDHKIKVPVPANDGFVDVASNGWGWMAVDKFRPRLQYGMTNGNASLGMLSEQNRVPRTNRSKGQWASSISSMAYIPRTGASNVQENSIIYADQFNKEDFSVNYPNAKFFVIKSYSEDDVHKSIKYNVWSSTPSGNRKLASAYEDAHQISAGNPKDCPIFLFFSVNASGQFCGVAEMVGPVDFHKDMDFWQQDKWTGSLPVTWHIVKDVPNASFRHIILENNENKPVTNSRDTQEVPYVQGISMLNMFKYSPLKTSLLDVFMYYEERQKIMQEEKSRFLRGTYDGSFFIPSYISSNMPNGTIEPPVKTEEKHVEYNGTGISITNGMGDHPQKTDEKQVGDNGMGKASTGEELVFSEADGDGDDSEGMKLKSVDVIMKIGSLSIESKDDHTDRDALEEDVTVGSISVKVNGFEGKSS